MNPIPLNDRGQYRYTDLVGYIPDFLKEEPDVVELLQIFSDYMNNAYRNIESVQRFDFKLTISESRIGVAKKRLGTIRRLFEIASGREDKVAILSLPRSNVKSNAVYSKSNPPYTVEVGYDSVSDTIENANRIDPNLLSMSDGDVVYVNYSNVDNNPQIGYYVLMRGASRCDLVRETKCGSQDPFTGSENSTGRIVTFKVSDISSIYSRYGSTVDGCKYYEVFFSATVSDVESEDAFSHHSLDDGGNLVVDYYGMHSVSQRSLGENQYYTTVGFSEGDSWEWKSGYPTAIIYMLGTSTANMTGMDYNGSETCADPSVVPSVNRYIVNVAESGSQAIATSASMIPLVDNMMVSITDMDGNLLGRYIASAVTGNPKQVKLAPADGDSTIAAIIAAERVIMISGTLYYSREVGDIGGWASVTMTPVETYDTMGNISKVYACSIVNGGDNIFAGEGTIEMLSDKRIHVSGEACRYLTGNNSPWKLYCYDVMWNGVMTVSSVDQDETGVTITYRSIDTTGITETSGTAEIVILHGGYVTVNADGTYNTTQMAKIVENTAMVAMYSSAEDGMSYGRKVYNVAGNMEIDCADIEPGLYFVEIVNDSDLDNVVKTVKAKTYNSTTMSYTVVASAISGDVYGCDYYVILDTDGKKHLAHNSNGIIKFTDGAGYLVGDIVSYGEGVYKCIDTVAVGSDETPDAGLSFINVTSDYRYYTREYDTNDYMPFYGQIAALDYDENIDYIGVGDPDVFTLPLYICKAEDIRLKYGWEHREFLYHPESMNRDTKSRNGYVEFYETSCAQGHDDCFINEHDAVRYVPTNRIAWSLDYPVVHRGYDSEVTLYVNNIGTVNARKSGDEWVVTMRSSAHGLYDGCEVTVQNFPTDLIDINVGYAAVDVIDGDTFTYRVPIVGQTTSSEILIDIPDDVVVKYVADYRYTISGVPTQVSSEGGRTVLSIPLSCAAIGLYNGDSVAIEYMFDGLDSVRGVVYEDTVADNAVITVSLPTSSLPVDEEGNLKINVNDWSRVRGSIHEDDIVKCGDTMYRVMAGEWERMTEDSLIVPITLFSKDNLTDVSTNNPYTAVGELHDVEHIVYQDGVGIVYVHDGFEHFTDNGSIVNGHTMVYIDNAYPSDYNGWHLVKEVLGARKFSIEMKLGNPECTEAIGVNNEKITIREGMWYKYTINSVDWSKVSNRATYYGSNMVETFTDDASDSSIKHIITKLSHGFSENDRIVFAEEGGFYTYDAEHPNVEFCGGRVVSVQSDTKFTVRIVNGSLRHPTDSDPIKYGVAKGIILDGPMNCVNNRNGEYTTAVYDDNDYQSNMQYTYRFMDRTLVVARGQYNSNERMVYIVNADGYWMPMRAKRAMKITSLDVEQYRTETYYDYYDPDKVNAYTYETYSDVDVANFSGAYMLSGMYRADHAEFYAPSLTDLDSTRNMATEYNSGEDFANVAPRTGMDSTFKGVPDMKYPLAERIERLCYLRDPNVIDYDLIGYLARFMGYDLTSLSDDIVESPVYRSKREREKAVREAVASLPQYYSLGGTDAGLRMLMDTFGVIGRVIPLWTNTNSPYKEMLSDDEVSERVSDDPTGSEGTWSPTTYIDLEIVHDERFPQFDSNSDDILRIKEQIRTFKPINVVFRDVIEKYVGYVNMKASMEVLPSSVSYSLGSASVVVGEDGTAEQSYDEIDYGIVDEMVTNCAF